jgi:hypothetical protein
MSFTDLLKILAILFAAVGLYLNFWQLRKSNSQRRAEMISDVLWKIYDDKELSEIYYQIEYHEFKYDDNFHGSDNERKLDKLITIFDILAKQYYLKLVTIKDLDFVSYECLVIYQNKEVNKYFVFLEDWFKRRGMKNPPFIKFRELGKLVEDEYFRS